MKEAAIGGGWYLRVVEGDPVLVRSFVNVQGKISVPAYEFPDALRLGMLAEVRAIRGQSLAEVSQLVDVSVASFWNWERGEAVPIRLSRKALLEYLTQGASPPQQGLWLCPEDQAFLCALAVVLETEPTHVLQDLWVGNLFRHLQRPGVLSREDLLADPRFGRAYQLHLAMILDGVGLTLEQIERRIAEAMPPIVPLVDLDLSDMEPDTPDKA